MKKVYGYVRVSTNEQNTDRQMIVLQDYAKRNNLEYDYIFEDKVSGRSYDRPAYQEMKELLEEGDTVVIKELDRLGRDWRGNDEEYRWFEENRVNLIVIDQEIISIKFAENETEDLMNRLIRDITKTLLNYTAQAEREQISRRTKEGMEAARKRGKQIGAERKHDYAKVVELREKGMTYTQISEETGIPRGSLQYIIKNYA